MKPMLSLLLAAGVACALEGCAVAPAYQRPDAGLPGAFKEAPATPDWKRAEPSEHVLRGQWWTVFGDATLDALEARALAASQDLQAAMARVREARALEQTARAGLFPALDAGVGPTRSRGAAAAGAQTEWRAQVRASYDADLFGGTRALAAATRADTQQSEAMLRSVHLALQADVATNYFTVRQRDAELAVVRQTVALREQARDLLGRLFDAGDISELDVARANAELASARSDAMTLERSRAEAEHSLAVLVGAAPAQFMLEAAPFEPVQVRVPAGLPSALLERRPDIAEAERAMAAANARIGAAQAAFFPALVLTGDAGFASGALGDLFRWSNRAFLLGPLVGTAFSVPLFDGGRRRGDLANRDAQYQESVARYRQRILVALREVEDQLSALRIVTEQRQVQAGEVQASTRAAHLSRALYTQGAVSYLDVIVAERTVQQSRRTAVALAGSQAIATVQLITALGGGWAQPMLIE